MIVIQYVPEMLMLQYVYQAPALILLLGMLGRGDGAGLIKISENTNELFNILGEIKPI